MEKIMSTETNNTDIITLFDPVLRDLIHSAPEYIIDNIESPKSMVIGRNYLNQSKTFTPYIRITVYISEDYENNIKKMTIREYQKEVIVLFNGGIHIASPNTKSYIQLKDYNGTGAIPISGINQLKTLLTDRILDINDNMNPGILTHIKYL